MPPHSSRPSSRRRRSRAAVRRRRIVIWSSVGVAVAVAGVAAWGVGTALGVRGSLEAAQAELSVVADAAQTGDLDSVRASATQLAEHAADARSGSDSLIWRAGEALPGVGDNFTAVGEIAGVVDAIAADAVMPLVDATANLGPEILKPVDGRLNTEPIRQIAEAIDGAAATIDAAAERTAAIDTAGTIGQVSAAKNQMTAMFDGVEPRLDEVRGIGQSVTDLLGMDEPKRYLLMFQNNAETAALGGATAALAEVEVDDGAVEITRQAGSEDIPWRDTPITDQWSELDEVYVPVWRERLNLSTSRPDFPTAAALGQAFWADEFGQDVDGVFAVDPGALALVLGATGPVSMESGDSLTADNAVDLLMSEIYERAFTPGRPWEEANAETSEFFADATSSVMSAITGFSGDANALADALAEGVDQHRILAWSPDEATQRLFERADVAGVLDTDNEDETQFGVFFADVSASKLSYYLRTETTVTTDACETDGPARYTVTATMRSVLEPGTSSSLPMFVRANVGNLSGGQFRTESYLFGPPGSTLVEQEVVQSGTATNQAVYDDLGRPISKAGSTLAPGETATVSATFELPESPGTPIDVWTTPGVAPTEVTIDAPGCRTAR